MIPDILAIAAFQNLLAEMLERHPGFISHQIVDRIRDDFDKDHSIFTRPLQNALDACDLQIVPKPKGN